MFALGTSLFGSFNMLAQSMASSKMFTYVPKGQLRKNVRWPRVRQPVCVVCVGRRYDSNDGNEALRNKEKGDSQPAKASLMRDVTSKI